MMAAGAEEAYCGVTSTNDWQNYKTCIKGAAAICGKDAYFYQRF